MVGFLGFIGTAAHAAYDGAGYGNRNWENSPEVMAGARSLAERLLGVETVVPESEADRKARVNAYMAEMKRINASEAAAVARVQRECAIKFRAEDERRNPYLVAEAAMYRTSCLALRRIVKYLQNEIERSGQSSSLLARLYVKDRAGQIQYGFKHDGTPALVSDEKLYSRFEEFYNRIYRGKTDFFYKIGYGYAPSVKASIHDQPRVYARRCYYEAKKEAYMALLNEHLDELRRVDPNNALFSVQSSGRYLWAERGFATMAKALTDNGLPAAWDKMLLITTKAAGTEMFKKILRQHPCSA